ncbi:hypothetical protein [Eisenbergiella sp.]
MAEQAEDAVISKTYLYLENYNEMQRYISEAVSEVSQVEHADIYNISAERAFLRTIRECKAETIILFEHINKSLEALERDAEAAGEGYKFDALRMKYIEGKTYEDIRNKWNCGKNAPKEWCKTMVKRLSIKLFGAKAIDK